MTDCIFSSRSTRPWSTPINLEQLFRCWVINIDSQFNAIGLCNLKSVRLAEKSCFLEHLYIYPISLFLIELNAFRLLFFSGDSSKYYSLVRFLDVKLVYRGSILVSLQAPNSGDVILVCTQLVASAHIESSYYVTMFFDYLQFSDSHIQTWHVK